MVWNMNIVNMAQHSNEMNVFFDNDPKFKSPNIDKKKKSMRFNERERTRLMQSTFNYELI